MRNVPNQHFLLAQRWVMTQKESQNKCALIVCALYRSGLNALELSMGDVRVLQRKDVVARLDMQRRAITKIR